MNSAQLSNYPYDNYYYWTPPPATEPSFCIGKAHVFECEHVDACKCGAIQRVMPRGRLVNIKPRKASK